MKRHLKLPKRNSTLQSYEFNNNSLIIIGANGSGKSRFGAWIEKNDLNNVHRIGAQRSLQFDEYILLKSYKQAENLVLTGKEELDKNKSHRWSYGKYTNSLLRDFDAVLSALIAKKNLESDEYLKECKELEKNDEQHKPVPKNDIDKLYEIWNSIYPHRNIEIKDAQVKVKYKDMEYNGNEMSDGERVALYLICQCLVVPQGKILIIDEPEVHLHRSIMNILWREIEKNRPDCFFIYITHDTQFAAGHTHSKKIWIKDFDGNNWDWEFIDKTKLPEECLLDILGNRKNVLFVEGTQNSYDTKIYKKIFDNYYVIPCGSCVKVIEYTKSINSLKDLHHLEAVGLIDRDYRTENEILSLKKDNIYVLDISEVENLFCIEEVLKIVNENQGFDNDENINKVKKYIEERFRNGIDKQINKSITSQIKYLLSIYDLSGKNIDDVQKKFSLITKEISFDDIKMKVSKEFEEALKNKNYSSILRLFNEKGLSKNIGNFFNINNNDYCDLIIRLLYSNQSSSIIEGMKKCLPSFK